MNSTIVKFGFPGSLVKEYDYWVVLVRPRQVTLGSLVLCIKSDAEALGQVTPQEFSELARITSDIESALARSWQPDKLNYLALMMVDPHVHFHIIPRYSTIRHFEGKDYSDVGWPRHPEMVAATETSPTDLERLRLFLAPLFG